MRLISLFFLFTTFSMNGQSIETLYENDQFEELITYADSAANLEAEELYYVGYAFFQLENDRKAVEFYDLAIEKGMIEDHIFLMKGVGLRFDQQYEKALTSLKKAIELNPPSQKNHSEIGYLFYEINQYDSALYYFKKARNLEYEHGDPYYQVPRIYHELGAIDTALEEYYKSADMINHNDDNYLEILNGIAQLEQFGNQNFEKAIQAYRKIFEIEPQLYGLIPSYIKAYHANEDYTKADSLFEILRKAYDRGDLPEEMQKYGSADIGQFAWTDRKILIYKKFKKAEDMLEPTYIAYVLSKDGSQVERTLLTEKTLDLGNGGPTHLLCEQKDSGAHATFPYGWTDETLSYASFKEKLLIVLNEEVSPSASSSPGKARKEKKNQRDKE